MHSTITWLCFSLMSLNFADNASTYIVLTMFADTAYEANPFNAWLFNSIGMIPALFLEWGLSGLLLLSFAKMYPNKVTATLFTCLNIFLLYVVSNNLYVFQKLSCLG